MLRKGSYRDSLSGCEYDGDATDTELAKHLADFLGVGSGDHLLGLAVTHTQCLRQFRIWLLEHIRQEFQIRLVITLGPRVSRTRRFTPEVSITAYDGWVGLANTGISIARVARGVGIGIHLLDGWHTGAGTSS